MSRLSHSAAALRRTPRAASVRPLTRPPTSGRSYTTQPTAAGVQPPPRHSALPQHSPHHPACTSYQPLRHLSIPSTTVDSSLERKIEQVLQEKLRPTHLEVEDTSGGCGAFFRLLVVSQEFQGLSIVKQHRYVNELLKDIVTNIHGMTLVTKTPEGYEKEVKAQVHNL